MLNQISSHSRQSIVLTLRPAVFDRYILALNEACFLQTLAQRDHEVRGVSERGAPQETNNRHRRLLRPRRERPRRRAAEERDELASPHAQPTSGLGPYITTPLRKNAAVHHSKNCALMSQMGRN